MNWRVDGRAAGHDTTWAHNGQAESRHWHQDVRVKAHVLLRVKLLLRLVLQQADELVDAHLREGVRTSGKTSPLPKLTS